MQAYSTTRKRVPETAVALTGPASLSVRRGRLHIEEGFGNLGNRRVLEFEPPLKLQSILLLTQGGTWSDHALTMLAENGVALYRLRQSGEVQYYLLPPDGAYRPGLLRLQASLPQHPLGLEIARWLIEGKVRGQGDNLLWLERQTTLRLPGETGSGATLSLDAVTNAASLEQVRIAEALAAELYFETLKGWPVSFAKPAGRCVEPPAHWLRFESRRSRRTTENSYATDPLNALLNFGYAIAAAETMIACRAASVDPCLGLIHNDTDYRPSFVYDLMEPLRPHVDRFSLELSATRTFRMNHDFMLVREGVCRLGIELAAEVGASLSSLLRPLAVAVVAEVRRRMLQAVRSQAPSAPWLGKTSEAPKPATEPTPNTSPTPASQCGRCSCPVPPTRRYCDACCTAVRAEGSARGRAYLSELRRPVDGQKSPMAQHLGEAMARSNRLKPRRRKETPEEKALRELDGEALRDALWQLTPEERSVVTARFGLTGGARMTQAEVATQTGLTLKQVRLRERTALSTLRGYFARPS